MKFYLKICTYLLTELHFLHTLELFTINGILYSSSTHSNMNKQFFCNKCTKFPQTKPTIFLCYTFFYYFYRLHYRNFFYQTSGENYSSEQLNF